MKINLKNVMRHTKFFKILKNEKFMINTDLKDLKDKEECQVDMVIYLICFLEEEEEVDMVKEKNHK